MTTTKHSDKALATLAAMRTAPDAWTLTPIDWVEEERMVQGLVTCPTCDGNVWVRLDDAGAVIPPPARRGAALAWEEYNRAARNEAQVRNNGHYHPGGNCPRCRVARRGWGVVSTGRVKGLVSAKVMVGYPRFPKGTNFDARFSDGSCRCHLCGKPIAKSLRVPVNTEDGHGMWVGTDCAQKFLTVTLKRKKDSIMEDGAR